MTYIEPAEQRTYVVIRSSMMMYRVEQLLARSCTHRHSSNTVHIFPLTYSEQVSADKATYYHIWDNTIFPCR